MCSVKGEQRPRQRTVIVVGSDDTESDFLLRNLRAAGYLPVRARTGREATEMYGEHTADVAVVVLHVGLPDQTAYSVLRALKAINPHVRVVVSTGLRSEDTVRAYLNRLLHVVSRASGSQLRP